MQSIYLIRHGESEANQKHICAGHTDVALTPLGLEQARQAGDELLKSNLKIDLIISSPLRRALDTAKEIAKAIHYPEATIIVREEAIERYRGDLEGRPTSLQKHMTNDQYIAHGAESEAQMQERAIALLAFINDQPEGNILVVSHNQFGRSLLAHLNHRDRAEVERLPNAHILKIT